MTGSGEDNIQAITDRVKKLLKDVFTAHVELTIEARKWKNKYLKCTNKRNELKSKTTNSPLNVSNLTPSSIACVSNLSLSENIVDITKDDTNARHRIKHPKTKTNFLFKDKDSPPDNKHKSSPNKANAQRSLTADVTNCSKSKELTTSSRVPNVSKVSAVYSPFGNKSLVDYSDDTSASGDANQYHNRINGVHSNNIQKARTSSTGSCTVIDNDNNSRNSELDFETPEPFVPSWKRRQCLPMLVVPDTEPMDWDEHVRGSPAHVNVITDRRRTENNRDINKKNPQHIKKMNNTPIISYKKESLGQDNGRSKLLSSTSDESNHNEFKPADNTISSGSLKPESFNISDTLKEFISPSPEKKKVNYKPERKKTGLLQSCRIRTNAVERREEDDIFSFLCNATFEQTSIKPKSSPTVRDEKIVDNLKHSGNVNKEEESHKNKKCFERNDVMFQQNAGSPSDPQVVDLKSLHLRNNLSHQAVDKIDAGSCSELYDADETYCPIMREKELFEKQQAEDGAYLLCNASMRPDLRLSQFCTLDPDQTMDPNFGMANHTPAPKDRVVISTGTKQTPLPDPSLLQTPDDHESPKLIEFGVTEKDPFHDHFRASSTHNIIAANGVNAEMSMELSPLLAAPACRDSSNKVKENYEKNFKKPFNMENSFDRVPTKKSNSPNYAHVDVVRKRDERYKLDAFACDQCKKWYDAVGISEEERKERMKSCRHRTKFEPTSTPEHFWSVGFPDTEVCRERGYIEVEDANNQPVSRLRRKRAYKKIF